MTLVDNATFIFGTGRVLTAPVGSKRPTATEIENWVKAGATEKLGAYEVIGHTSLEELPQFERETEGGEVKGSWENNALRKTPITTTETVSVNAIQWTPEVMKLYYGDNAKYDSATKRMSVGSRYVGVERALLVVALDDNGALVWDFLRVQSQPNGSVELSAEDFASMPIQFTVLGVTGKDPYDIIPLFFNNSTASTTGTTPATQ